MPVYRSGHRPYYGAGSSSSRPKFSSSSGTRLAEPNGEAILKTAAQKEYKLSPADLLELNPVSDQKSFHGGSHNIQKFNRCDVKWLAENVKKRKEGKLATKKGGEISRSRAKEDYGLTVDQLNTILPCTEKPNPWRQSEYETARYYNICDVEALQAKVRDANSFKKPTSVKGQVGLVESEKEKENASPSQAIDRTRKGATAASSIATHKDFDPCYSTPQSSHYQNPAHPPHPLAAFPQQSPVYNLQQQHCQTPKSMQRYAPPTPMSNEPQHAGYQPSQGYESFPVYQQFAASQQSPAPQQFLGY